MTAKRQFFHSFSIVIVTALLLILFSCPVIYAQDEVAGRIVKVKGEVHIFNAKKLVWEPAVVGRTLERSDIIRTGKDGRAAILLEDETMMQLNKGSQLVLENVVPKAGWNRLRKVAMAIKEVERSIYKVIEGEIWFRNKDKGASFIINAPTMTTSVRGTDLTIQVSEDNTVTLSVLEGFVEASNEFGSTRVGAGEQAVAHPGAPPRKQILLRPIDAVQWTITIPLLIEPHLVTDPYILRAYNLLMDGEIRDAYNLLIEITKGQPALSVAWSMLSIGAIALGEKQLALDAAEKGVALSPQSVVALIVKSYTLQAVFDIDKAVEAIEKAMALDNKHLLVLTHLARLKFATDYVDDAWGLIKKAEGFGPEDAEIQNLTGFIALAKQKTQDAIPAFKKAIQLNPGLGEPHMGLALAYMRQGDVAIAMEEITTAVLLEPQRALFLSYWGKMLYQIKRFDQALDILKFAGRLDPNDPTSELYKAIILRDLNKPTDAIDSLNQAIRLNDNRAVYRSRFLLDRDLAVKNVDLSILYNQLGLTSWARNKALASIKQDYANSSGHLFLAGTLRDDGDRSWAYAGETLLARMFMPANLNSFNTFNEYTPFFEQPSINGTITGNAGSFKSTGGELITYGGIPAANVAFGAAAVYSDIDGWRRTNDERQGNLAVIAKWDMTPRDNLMFVASYQKAKQGDKVYPRYNYDSPADPESFQKNRLTRLEMGYHHKFSPNSNILFYLAHLENNGAIFDNRVKDAILDFNIDKGYKMPYTQAQLQYLYKSRAHQVIAGTTQYWGDYRNEYMPIINNTTFAALYREGSSIQYIQSYYAQDTWRIHPKLTFEGALYFDRMKDGDANMDVFWNPNKGLLILDPTETEIKKSEWSPRAGLIFTPVKNDTFRLAAFRYLLPFISSRLDPTDIAGVPVYRNGAWGSVIKEYDLVWEHEWSTGFLSTNLFYLDKDYSYNKTLTNAENTVYAGGRMKGFETILNQLLMYGFGLNAGYRYKKINEETLPQADREEHQAKAGLKYLHKSGLSWGATQTYQYQNMKAQGSSNETIWLTDANIGYELPGKRGFLKIEVRNIFDQHFNWATDYYTLTGRTPEREIFGTVSVNF